MAKNGPTTVGENIVAEHDGKILTLKIDMTKEIGPSGSGKTILLAKTGRNVPVANVEGRQIILGLNLYRYAEER